MTNTINNNKNAILVGVIIAPHGVAGAVSAESLSDNPRRFIAGAQFFDEQGATYTLEKASPHKGRLLLLFQGVHSRDDAEALRGVKLYIDASTSAPLPEGEYHHYQLIGLQVRENGALIGQLEDILSYSANDVFLVRTTDGHELLLPALKSVVKKVDIPAGYLDAEIPEGLR